MQGAGAFAPVGPDARSVTWTKSCNVTEKSVTWSVNYFPSIYDRSQTFSPRHQWKSVRQHGQHGLEKALVG